MFSRAGTAVAVCILAIFGLLQLRIAEQDARTPTAYVDLKKLPYEIGNWRAKDAEPMNYQSKNILQLDEYIRRVYVDPAGRQIFVYVGYWKKQSGDYQAAKHSPLTCLPANGWKVEQTKDVTFATDENAQPIEARRLPAGFRGDKSLFYYWFFAGTDHYVEESSALAHVVAHSLGDGRKDGGIVELSTAQDIALTEAEADERLADFAKLFYPELKKLITSPSGASPPHQ